MRDLVKEHSTFRIRRDAIGQQIHRAALTQHKCLRPLLRNACQNRIGLVIAGHLRIDLGHRDLPHVHLHDQVCHDQSTLEFRGAKQPIQCTVVPVHIALSDGLIQSNLLGGINTVTTEAPVIKILDAPFPLLTHIRQNHRPKL